MIFVAKEVLDICEIHPGFIRMTMKEFTIPFIKAHSIYSGGRQVCAWLVHMGDLKPY